MGKHNLLRALGLIALSSCRYSEILDYHNVENVAEVDGQGDMQQDGSPNGDVKY
jgi:hypothetical protein